MKGPSDGVNLTQFINKFTSDEVIAVHDVSIISNNLFLVSPNLKKLLHNLRSKPFSAGVFLGSMRNSAFLPSFQLLDLLIKKTARKITLSEKAAWLFVCGRDVFKQGIIAAQGNPSGDVKADIDAMQNGGLILIQNEHGECLGYGQWQGLSSKIVVKNILDRGDFLRRER